MDSMPFAHNACMIHSKLQVQFNRLDPKKYKDPIIIQHTEVWENKMIA